MKAQRRILKQLALVAVFWVVVLGTLVLGLLIDARLEIAYVSSQLGVEAKSWDDVDATFRSLFQVGASREQVIQTLMAIDPLIETQLVPDSRIGCNVECCETLLVFRDRLGRKFAHIFCYDDNFELLYVTLGS